MIAVSPSMVPMKHVAFLERPYPSTNAVLLRAELPTRVDRGYGSDVPSLVARLASFGVDPEQLALVVNTRYHSGHVGGNRALPSRHGAIVAVPVGAHA